ncbi:hypothetical protein ACIBUQ_50175 [Nonomuraea sp. NPDC049377]|uniref:hypothetical protein n=1 Tax=Nonomuraea sp. NPDC049377 TaxID=3364351 RepID=UPI00378BBEF9
MVIIVRFLCRFHTHGQAMPPVNVTNRISPTVHAGFDTDRPTFRTSNGSFFPIHPLLCAMPWIVRRLQHAPGLPGMHVRSRTPQAVPPA